MSTTFETPGWWSQPDGGAGRENSKMNAQGSYRGVDLLRDGLGVDRIPRFSDSLSRDLRLTEVDQVGGGNHGVPLLQLPAGHQLQDSQGLESCTAVCIIT